jgi:hypothetical protein
MVIYPHPTATNSIVIGKEQMDALKPGNMVGDEIVNAWLRYTLNFRIHLRFVTI